jgi:hypothetical protein
MIHTLKEKIMWDKIKKVFLGEEQSAPAPTPEPEMKVKKPRQPREPKAKVELTPKEQATQNGEAYIAITKVDLDPNDINNGSFELDWNDKFVINLVKQGYRIKATDTDNEIVDRWFQTVCRNVALEIYEQEKADPDKRDDVRIIQQRDLGNGFTEVS